MELVSYINFSLILIFRYTTGYKNSLPRNFYISYRLVFIYTLVQIKDILSISKEGCGLRQFTSDDPLFV